jgi:hypothetical protein
MLLQKMLSKFVFQNLVPIIVAASSCFIATAAQGQSVTIDFTRTRGNPSVNIPWSEDGFTVTSPTPVEFGKPGGVSVTTGNSIPGTTPFPPSGLLQFRAGGLSYTLVTAFLTNDLSQTFDLLSLDFYSARLSTTSYARVYSSAGGSFDLLATPDQTTLTFNGDAWRNLSFVAVDLLSVRDTSSQLLLNNFVVQVNAVPEPSSAHIVLLLVSTCLWKVRHVRRGVRLRL